MTQHEPPPVTIADPSGSPLPLALAGSRLATPRNRRVWYAVLLLLPVILAARQLAGGADHAGLRDTAIAVIGTVATGSDADPSAVMRLRIVNTGPERVLVRDVQLNVPAWRGANRPSAALEPQQDTVLTFSHRWHCELAEAPPSLLSVRVRATDGQSRVLSVPLPVAVTTLEGLRSGTCGELGPAAAVDLGHTSAVLQTRPAAGNRQVTVLLVDLELVNRSTQSFAIVRAGVRGLASESAGPLTLPPRSAGTPAGPTHPVHLQLTLRAKSCPPTAPVDDVDLQLDRGQRAASVEGLRELMQILASAACSAHR